VGDRLAAVAAALVPLVQHCYRNHCGFDYRNTFHTALERFNDHRQASNALLKTIPTSGNDKQLKTAAKSDFLFSRSRVALTVQLFYLFEPKITPLQAIF